MLALCLAFAGLCTDDLAADSYREISSAHSKANSEVVTLTLTGMKFIGQVPHDYNGITSEEIESLAQNVAKAIGNLSTENGVLQPADKSVLEPVTESLFPSDVKELSPTTPNGGWRPFRLVQRADDIKVEDGVIEVVRKNGTEDRYDPRLRQASVFSSHTGLVVERLDTFIPRLPELTEGEYSIDTAEEQYRLTCGDLTVVFDPATTFVQEIQRLQSGNRPIRRLQYSPMNLGLPVPVARCLAEIRSFKSGEISSLNIYVINSFEHNTPVDEADFQLSVPEGTRVVKFAEGEALEGARVGRAAGTDTEVRQQANQPDFGKEYADPHVFKADKTAPPTSRPLWLLWGNALIVFVMLVVWLTRKFRG